MMRFLLKGLMRDSSRSLFPVLMVATGAFLTVFLYSWLRGAIGGIANANAQFDTGYVKVVTHAYQEIADTMPNDLAIVDVEDMLKKVHAFDKEMIWTPRIRFGGLIDIPDAKGETRVQGPAIGLGVRLFDPGSPEYHILNLSRAIVQGRAPQKPREIMIGEAFAQKLNVHVGDTATLISSTMNGSMAVYNFTIVGLMRFGISVLDKSMVIADFSDMQNVLDMQDAASEIVGYTQNMIYHDPAMMNHVTRFNQLYYRSDDDFSPVMMALSEQNDLGSMLRISKRIGSIIVFVFVTAMSIVLWNAGLMGNIRRYGEIGIRLAMGESKAQVYRRMLFESFLIGIAGSVIGTACGLLISYYMQYAGIDIGNMIQKANMIISTEMRAEVTIISYIIGFMPGLVAPLFGTMASGIGIYRRQTAQLFRELDV